jgi:N-acetylglucosaminyl-diphospho-decaprenol L-rhamnosyltransferase
MPYQHGREIGVPQITISIVSHNHGALILKLLDDLNLVTDQTFEVLITNNVPEPTIDYSSPYQFPVCIIHNNARKGFGANHNAAFKMARGKYFCVLNPDIRLPHNPFPVLLSAMETGTTGIAAPRVVNGAGLTEDSARPFPRISCIVRKVLGRPECSRYSENNIPNNPDWVAGMFMLIRRETYQALHGFNEGYFMYYEDVELCARARNHGWGIAYCASTSVVHEARRDSHKNLRFLTWHLTSMLRYLLSGVSRKALSRN